MKGGLMLKGNGSPKKKLSSIDKWKKRAILKTGLRSWGKGGSKSVQNEWIC